MSCKVFIRVLQESGMNPKVVICLDVYRDYLDICLDVYRDYLDSLLNEHQKIV